METKPSSVDSLVQSLTAVSEKYLTSVNPSLFSKVSELKPFISDELMTSCIRNFERAEGLTPSEHLENLLILISDVYPPSFCPVISEKLISVTASFISVLLLAELQSTFVDAGKG